MDGTFYYANEAHLGGGELYKNCSVFYSIVVFPNYFPSFDGK